MKLLQNKEPINKTFAVTLAFKNWHCVLHEDGTHVPKHVGEAHVMFILIKHVHLVGVGWVA
jgi:hypothetical protein